jgi:pimeloyl-ACP methyl ester carboxylesterase
MRVETNGLALEVSDEGDGPPVLLLHGWPDSHALWRHQVTALREAGFRTIAPDLRGFGASDRPAEVEQYNLLFLVADVTGLLDALGLERVHLVGHDWGAALSWVVASLAPDRIDHLVAMSVGHPGAFASAGMEQRERSWYTLLFQFEEVAEQWLAQDDWANFRALFRHPDADDRAAALSEPGALTASLNYYRANVPAAALLGPAPDLPPIQAPTMGLWSPGDRHLVEEQMTGSGAFVAGPWRFERIEADNHWLQLVAPDAVNEALLDFLPAPSAGASR